jgi:hypothetical protein
MPASISIANYKDTAEVIEDVRNLYADALILTGFGIVSIQWFPHSALVVFFNSLFHHKKTSAPTA